MNNMKKLSFLTSSNLIISTGIIVVVVIGFAGCQTAPEVDTTTSTPEVVPVVSTIIDVPETEIVDTGLPMISIVIPEHGDYVETSVTLHVAVANFELDPAAVGTENQTGVGQYAVLVDNAVIGYRSEAETVVEGISPGEHTVRVELVNNDNSELSEPAVSQEITVIIQ